MHLNALNHKIQSDFTIRSLCRAATSAFPVDLRLKFASIPSHGLELRYLYHTSAFSILNIWQDIWHFSQECKMAVAGQKFVI